MCVIYHDYNLTCLHVRNVAKKESYVIFNRSVCVMYVLCMAVGLPALNKNLIVFTENLT